MSGEEKKSEIALREEEILRFWKENDIFKKSLTQTEKGDEFVFYEGPPTANGRPGIHHLESRAFKDAIPRYKTMRGYHVRRKAGWDTHGLPVELEVEKDIGVSSKKEIEEYGIGRFNEKCKESVWKYVDEWVRFTERIGYWLDLRDPYVTYEPSYIESLWYVLKQVSGRDLLYKDYKVVPWCPRCGTALSSHELAQGYEDVKDLSVTARFRLSEPFDGKETSILAWTTTPWTLPGNVALAVGSEVSYGLYSVVRDSETEYVIAAVSRAEVIFEGLEYSLEKEVSSDDLVGRAYEPLYPYLKELAADEMPEALEQAYRIYEADFVTTEEGTGIVHTAVMYGQDDFTLGTDVGLPKFHLVDEDGHFIGGTDFLEGRFVKEEETDVEIIKNLAHRGLLFAKEKYEHTYPHCWRCKTPLIYYARDSWYIGVSELKDELIAENAKIGWEPSHLKEGRFGEWLEGVRDWAISRERYWGTPLPVWENEDGSRRTIIGSIEELKEKTKSTNSYIVLRHGEAEHNTQGIMTADPDGVFPLTARGEKESRAAARELNGKVDLIIASPILRTQQTAEIFKEELGLSREAVVFDERLREVDPGEYEGIPIEEYVEKMGHHKGDFTRAPKGGESFNDLRRRMGDFLYDIDETYEGKKILLITHSGPAWMLFSAAHGLDEEMTLGVHSDPHHFIQPGEYREVDFAPIPHDSLYHLDLHRPYIDEIGWEENGEIMRRTPEVMDVWFDSGAMPFAQDHYPFENKEWVEGPGFPADFISEAIDQTRGWFYTLHAVGVLMGRGAAYKNVISLGHLLDAEGQKMSKSKGNTVDPWKMADTYGVDALRFWMYSINQPGESKNFDEKTVDEIVKKVFNILRNVVRFWEMYRDEDTSDVNPRESTNVLDMWIITRLDALIQEMTESIEKYNLIDPTRALRDFIGDDLSRWYIRRSRDRFKDTESDDRAYALATTRFLLTELSKLMAPFTPFIAEEVYGQVAPDGKESVHLEAWPDVPKEIDYNFLDLMTRVRHVVSLALDARAQEGIKVRQPLALLKVEATKYDLPSGSLGEELRDVIREEVNVKKVEFVEGVEGDVALETELTPDLIKEGHARELIRAIQSLRKKEGLDPQDEVVLKIDTDKEGRDIIEAFRDDIVSTASLRDIEYTDVAHGQTLELDDVEFRFRVTN